jgi:hypothetical protein
MASKRIRKRSRQDRGLGARPRSPRARDLVSQVAREAEPLYDWTVRHELAARPRTRGDCEPCAVCQGYADRVRAEYSPHDSSRAQLPVGTAELLACGHRTADALNHCRPCVRVSCSHNLYLDVGDDGHLRYNFPDRDPDELRETCALDVATRPRTAGGRNEPRTGVDWDEAALNTNLTSEGMRLMKAGLLKALRGEMAEHKDDDDQDDEGMVASPVEQKVAIARPSVERNFAAAPPRDQPAHTLPGQLGLFEGDDE